MIWLTLTLKSTSTYTYTYNIYRYTYTYTYAHTYTYAYTKTHLICQGQTYITIYTYIHSQILTVYSRTYTKTYTKTCTTTCIYIYTQRYYIDTYIRQIRILLERFFLVSNLEPLFWQDGLRSTQLKSDFAKGWFLVAKAVEQWKTGPLGPRTVF